MTDMIHPVGMPKWGLAMTEGQVNSWLVEDGAPVTAGQDLLEVETSKITNVHEAPASGLLRRRVAREGQVLPVGALLGVIADADVAEADIDAFVARYQETQAAEAASAAPPPAPQTIEVAGRIMRFLATGEGSATPLLLIHGFGGDLNNWMFNQPVLSETRPVYALDLPGHGGSAKTLDGADLPAFSAWVRAALDALRLDRVHLAGHSLGGAIALQTALDAPGRVASVTLICSAGLGPEIEMGYIDAFIRAERRREMKDAVEMLFADPSLVSRDMLEDLVRYKRLDGVGVALRAVAQANFAAGRQTRVLADRLGELRVPVQAIWGEADRIIPARHAEALPAGRRHVLSGSGHMVHLERAPDVNRLVLDFVAAA